MGARAYSDYPRILLQDAGLFSDTKTSTLDVQVLYWPLHPVVLDSSSFVLAAGCMAAHARYDICVWHDGACMVFICVHNQGTCLTSG